jgi:hypothetical protein
LSATTRDTTAGARKSRFGLLACMVVLLALVLREQFVLTGTVDYPIAGDIRDYFSYAWNLVQHGTFSRVPPDTGIPIADAYRSPGFPWLLAACLQLWPQDPNAATLGTWYFAALQIQVLLGTTSVLLTILIARLCAPDAWALVAGLLLALWPHHIAATGTLLSELAFGFALLAGLYCSGMAWKSDRKSWWIAAGAVFGYAYLINSLILFFPLMLVAAAGWKRRRTGAALLALVFLLPVALLAWRNAGIPTASDAPIGRAALNFVQGSWPNYHAAHVRYRSGDPVAVAIMDEINREAILLDRHPARGIREIGARLATAPLGYLRWYAWDKPWLLWDWNIRIGHGGFYFQDVLHSPLDRNPLRSLFRGFKALNPVLTLLALLGGIAVLVAGGKAGTGPASRIVAGLVCYLTLIHVVFQAEPRYANAYRGIEAVMVVMALAWVADRLARMSLARGQT